MNAILESLAIDGPASVHEALAAVMGELPAIGKDGKASAAQGGYSYRGIEQITKETQRLFAKHGVVIVPAVQSIDVREVTVQGKPWSDTTLVVNYTLVGPDGSRLEATTVGVGRDSADKGANKAMTQAFKYLLLQTLCISDAKDDADGFTHEADAAPLHPNSQRVADVLDDMRRMSADIQAEMKSWANGRSLAAPALLGDDKWLAQVESRVDELKALGA